MQQKNIPLPKDILSLGWGFIDETYNPGIIIKLVDKSISKRKYKILQYNDCLGLPELREYGKSFLQEKFGLGEIQTDEIMIINGATAGIDLASRYILEGKYDSIVLSPVYDTALESLKRNSKKIISIPLNLFEKENGDILDWIELEKAMQNENVKLIYVNPNFQNPTGIVFNHETKKRIYELAKKYGVITLEDDPYKLYNFSNSELGDNIIDMDEVKNNVIYLNSISKVFYPGLRIGFLVGNSKLVKGISELQKYSTSSPNLIMQGASIEAFERGEIDKSLVHYKREIGEKSNMIISALQDKGLLGENSPIEFSSSKGGFYLWGKFKNGLNTDDLSLKALQYGVSFVPGSIYGEKSVYNDSFRIAYAQIDKDKIAEAISRLHKLVQDSI